jgi:hypothetical protein
VYLPEIGDLVKVVGDTRPNRVSEILDTCSAMDLSDAEGNIYVAYTDKLWWWETKYRCPEYWCLSEEDLIRTDRKRKE